MTATPLPQVSIIMGSQSDWPVMQNAAHRIDWSNTQKAPVRAAFASSSQVLAGRPICPAWRRP